MAGGQPGLGSRDKEPRFTVYTTSGEAAKAVELQEELEDSLIDLREWLCHSESDLRKSQDEAILCQLEELKISILT